MKTSTAFVALGLLATLSCDRFASSSGAAGSATAVASAPGSAASAAPVPTASGPAPGWKARYRARLGPNDHYNSGGVKLTTPNEVLQMDRANYHKFSKRDPEDEDDPIFGELAKREHFLKYLQPLTPDVTYQIDTRTPLVDVVVYEVPGGYKVNVYLIAAGQPFSAPPNLPVVKPSAPKSVAAAPGACRPGLRMCQDDNQCRFACMPDALGGGNPPCPSGQTCSGHCQNMVFQEVQLTPGQAMVDLGFYCK